MHNALGSTPCILLVQKKKKRQILLPGSKCGNHTHELRIRSAGMQEWNRQRSSEMWNTVRSQEPNKNNK
jgi:hypothetical protein